jgi:hypothetical protein
VTASRSSAPNWARATRQPHDRFVRPATSITVCIAAGTVPVERRDLYLQRVGSMLKLRGRFDDSDVVAADRRQRGVAAASIGRPFVSVNPL